MATQVPDPMCVASHLCAEAAIVKITPENFHTMG